MLSTDDQNLVVAMVGDTPDNTLQAQVAAISSHYSFDAYYPGFGLEMLYVERDLIKVAYGWAWKQIQLASADAKLSLQQRAQALAVRLKGMEDEIAVRLAEAQQSFGGAASGCITTTAPISPPFPCPYPDANAPVYSGSPYYRQWKPQSS